MNQFDINIFPIGAFRLVRTHLLYISIAYYLQKRGGWVQIACKIAYVLNGKVPYFGPLKYSLKVLVWSYSLNYLYGQQSMSTLYWTSSHIFMHFLMITDIQRYPMISKGIECRSLNSVELGRGFQSFPSLAETDGKELTQRIPLAGIYLDSDQFRSRSHKLIADINGHKFKRKHDKLVRTAVFYIQSITMYYLEYPGDFLVLRNKFVWLAIAEKILQSQVLPLRVNSSNKITNVPSPNP